MIKDAAVEALDRRQTKKGYMEVLGRFRGPEIPPVWVSEHRLLVQRLMGRPLEDDEVVHHRDLNPGHNALVNLLLLPHHAVHDALHIAIARGREDAVFQLEEQWLRAMYGVPALRGGVIRRRSVDARTAPYTAAWDARRALLSEARRHLAAR